MMRKMILISLFVLLGGVLVLGGINRTLAKTTGTTLLQWLAGEQSTKKPRPFLSQGLNQKANSAETTSSNWESFNATIVSVNDLALQVELEDGRVLILEGRSWQYAKNLGFKAKIGEEIHISGFFDEGDFEAAILNHVVSGLEIQLRDSSGRPLWAGRGNSGQN
jgi:hypothetical protein